MGAIRAEPTPDPVVTVLATRHGRATDPDVRFEVVRHAAGVTVCAVYPTPAGTPPNECRPGRAGRQRNTPANDVEVEFLVRVPRGVGLVARSATGDITTGLLTAPVSAHSAAGHVDVRTTEYADASSASGNVSVRMGRAAWPDTLRVATRSGNIRVWLPAAADAHVTASTRAGTVRTDFALAGTRRSVWARLRPGADRGERVSGTLGAGGRHLLVESTAGTIAVRRGDRLPD
jgi:hypothetical protein